MLPSVCAGLMADYIYVDNSNLYIEGKRVSAVRKGLAMNIYDAMNNRILDFDYSISFGRLHEFVAGRDKSQNCTGCSFWFPSATQ